LNDQGDMYVTNYDVMARAYSHATDPISARGYNMKQAYARNDRKTTVHIAQKSRDRTSSIVPLGLHPILTTRAIYLQLWNTLFQLSIYEEHAE